jgi:hypothetical protein
MKRFFGYASAALAVLILAVNVVPSSALGSSSLSITPKKNYIIQPGQTITDKLTIGNIDKTDTLYLSLRMIDFTYTNQSGTPRLSIAQNAPQTAWSLKPFTTLPKEVTVGPGESKTVNYTIKIPKNMGAGSYYSAILYQAGGANGGNVALNASGVTLVFASVPGKVKENMSLQKFGAYNSNDNGATGSYVYVDVREQPKMVAFALKNEGNVFENPAGNVLVRDMFGHKVTNVLVNEKSSLALLGQTRLFASCIKTLEQKIKSLGGQSKSDTCVDPGLKPGRYTANLDVFYGQNGNQTHEITAVAHFWYLPVWFIVLILILLGAVAYGLWWLRKKIKTMIKGTTYRDGKGVKRTWTKK